MQFIFDLLLKFAFRTNIFKDHFDIIVFTLTQLLLVKKLVIVYIKKGYNDHFSKKKIIFKLERPQVIASRVCVRNNIFNDTKVILHSLILV